MKTEKSKRVFEAVTNEEIKKLHVLYKKSGLDEEAFYNIITNIIGIPSITALSKWEAGYIIARLEGKSGQLRPRRPRSENEISGDASKLPYLGHVKGIRAIVRNLEWDKEHFKAWLKKYMGIQSIRKLDRKRARDAFVALKKIQDYQKKEEKSSV